MRFFAIVLFSLSCLTMTAESETGDSLSSVKVAIDTATIELEQVTVAAQRPLVQVKADRTVYDVKNDEDAKTQMVIELLRKVPFVTVDGQNNIQVKGSSNFKVYKNGRPNQSFSKNPKEVLSSIPANMIKRIEVITEPGAKYDAEGLDGILNIVMDDELVVKGFSGSIGAGVGTTRQPYSSLWGTTQYGKLVTSAYFSVQRSSSRATENEEHAEYTYQNTGNRLMTDKAASNPGMMYAFGLDASYEADSLNLLTLSFSGFGYGVDVHQHSTDTMLGTDGETLYSYKREYLDGSDYQYFDLNGKIDYQHLTQRKGESLNLSYLLSTTTRKRNSDSQYDHIVNHPAYTRSLESSHNDYMEHTVQADWTRPLSEIHSMDFGAKYILRTNNSRSHQSQDGEEVTSSDFKHTTHVAAVYGEYRLTLDKLSLIGGLRYEWAYMDVKFEDGSASNFHKTIGDLVPSVTTNWRINDANSLKLSYSMRINRPGIYYLNPMAFSNPTSVSFGNPSLESANQHNIVLSYMLMKRNLYMNVSASTAFSHNQITPLQYVDNGLIYNTYDNVGKFLQMGIDAYLQWKITQKTTFMLNGNIRNSKYYCTDMHLSNRRWKLNFHSSLTQTLPWKLRVELTGGRSDGGATDMYTYSKGLFYYAMNVSRSFLKEDRMTVRFLAWNPFHKYDRYTDKTVNGDYRGASFRRMNGQLFSLHLSYRFGSLNTEVKKANKSIVNDDLVGRK